MYLLLCLQRVVRYKMLLERLLDCETDAREREDVAAALKCVCVCGVCSKQRT